LSGARIIEAIAGATSTQAVSSTVARIRLQKFLACFPMYASLVILVAVLTVVSLAIQIASLFRSASLQFLTASRVARNASPEEERPLAKRVKRGGACLCAHDLSSRQLRAPRHPQGYWLAETLSGAAAENIYAQGKRIPGAIPLSASLQVRTGFVRFVPRQKPPQLFREIDVVSHESPRASEDRGAHQH